MAPPGKDKTPPPSAQAAPDPPEHAPVIFVLKDLRRLYRSLGLATAEMNALPSDDVAKDAPRRLVLHLHSDRPGAGR